MHSYNSAYAYRLIRNIARAGLHMVTNPLDNSVLQGRFDTGPIRRGHTRVKELQEAGVNVCIGHDSVMDPWYPLGYGDPLQAAFVLAHYGQMSGDQELRRLIEMITVNKAARRTWLCSTPRRRPTRCGWSRRARWCCGLARSLPGPPQPSTP
jgi:cytosine/creatinine deaminase